MAACVVLEVDVKDQEKYESYNQMVPPSLAAYGGRFLVRGGKVETLEGEWSPKRLVILEFPSVVQAKAWWGSEEYAEVKAVREATAHSQVILVAGV